MKTVLIVDDEPNVRLALTSVLKAEKFNVISASDAEEANSVIKKNKPDLAIIDVMMPKKNGFELIHGIREKEDFSKMKIIILSVLSMNECWEKFLSKKCKESEFNHTNKNIMKKLGIDKFITKPFDNKALVKIVNKLI